MAGACPGGYVAMTGVGGAGVGLCVACACAKVGINAVVRRKDSKSVGRFLREATTL